MISQLGYINCSKPRYLSNVGNMTRTCILTISTSCVNSVLGQLSINLVIFLHQDISTWISINVHLRPWSLSPDRTIKSTIETTLLHHNVYCENCVSHQIPYLRYSSSHCYTTTSIARKSCWLPNFFFKIFTKYQSRLGPTKRSSAMISCAWTKRDINLL